ncbi:MAG TPA: hypothetical protein DCL54_18600 [Alphaproteobacteria bacterium]|nr:hypothetical protein [Alphaproteobacteria bacterium]HAJ48593.1 hypothetical protein [Alphaproteobacteria bacterium]
MSATLEDSIKSLSPLLNGSEDDFEQAAVTLRHIDAVHPHDAYAQYLVGSAYDSCGREALAIVHYEKVFGLGIANLPEVRRPELYVQTGSTLRNLRRFGEARKILAEGMNHYPDYQALRVFAALVDSSEGDPDAAARHLYACVLMNADGSLSRFRRALTYYVGEIGKADGDHVA